MDKFLLAKKICEKKTCWEDNFCQEKICEKKFYWENICQKKKLGNNFCKKKLLSEKKIIGKFFLSESGGCDKCDLIYIFVYQMGRLCGGAHEMSDIKAPLFLHGWVGGVLVRSGVSSGRGCVVGMVVFVD